MSDVYMNLANALEEALLAEGISVDRERLEGSVQAVVGFAKVLAGKSVALIPFDQKPVRELAPRQRDFFGAKTYYSDGSGFLMNVRKDFTAVFDERCVTLPAKHKIVNLIGTTDRELVKLRDQMLDIREDSRRGVALAAPMRMRDLCVPKIERKLAVSHKWMTVGSTSREVFFSHERRMGGFWVPTRTVHHLKAVFLEQNIWISMGEGALNIYNKYLYARIPTRGST